MYFILQNKECHDAWFRFGKIFLGPRRALWRPHERSGRMRRRSEMSFGRTLPRLLHRHHALLQVVEVLHVFHIPRISIKIEWSQIIYCISSIDLKGKRITNKCVLVSLRLVLGNIVVTQIHLNNIKLSVEDFYVKKKYISHGSKQIPNFPRHSNATFGSRPQTLTHTHLSVRPSTRSSNYLYRLIMIVDKVLF